MSLHRRLSELSRAELVAFVADAVTRYPDLEAVLPGADRRPPRPEAVGVAAVPVDALRAALHAEDAPGIVAMLADHGVGEPLQLVGDALRCVLAYGIAGADVWVDALLDRLRDRAAPGDALLAADLLALAGRGPMPPQRVLPVDLDELAGALETDPGLGEQRLDLTTGLVTFLDDDLDDDDEDTPHLTIFPEGGRAGWQDMAAFVDRLEDAAFAARLRDAITGRGALRRFTDLLATRADLRDRWSVFHEDRARGRAREWLAEHGLRPAARRR